MVYISVIPARGGSKRLPGKNKRLLNGKPLILYSIEYSMKEPLVSHTYVSTDDNEIKEIAESVGAEVLIRPLELSGDLVTTATVLRHTAKKIIESGVNFDYMILLQPTNPLRPKGLLHEAISLIEDNKYDGVMTVSHCDKKLGKIIDEKFIPWSYEFGQRSQDLEPLYYENGLLYIISKSLILNGIILNSRTYPLVINHVFGQVDIDTIDDFNFAEYLLNQNKE